MSSAEKILIVEDELPIADILRFNFEREGYRVWLAHDGDEALSSFARHQPDLVILDLMLPGRDGLDVCRELRRTSQVPILMLTARESEADKVLGLELGADDYVTKPFSPRELLARVRAILRRVQPPAGSEPVLRLGDLMIDAAAYRVERDGLELQLTPREFDLLHYLARHHGRVFSREALCREVWGYDYFGDARVVDVTIRRLREKLEPDPGQPRYVRTRRGVGYYFSVP